MHRVADFAESRPQIAKESVFAVLVPAEWIPGKINVNSTREGEGDNQRRRHQKIRLNMLVHARFEISISRKDRSSNQIVLVNGLLDVWMQRPGVADAGRTTVPNKIESELIEIFLQSGFVEIVRNYTRAGRERCFHCRIDAQTALNRFFRQQTGCDHHTRIARICATRDRRDQDATVPDVSSSLRKDLSRFGFNFSPGIRRWPVCNHLDFVEFVPRINSLILLVVG